jgi:WD40 repeat protein
MKFQSNTPSLSTKDTTTLALISLQPFPIPAFSTWVFPNQSMNILSINEPLSELYLCNDSSLLIFSLSPTFSLTLKSTLSFPPFRNTDSRITHMLLSHSLTEPILVVLTNSSLIRIFYPQCWDRAPQVLDNFSPSHDDNSVWSCSLHDHFLAVGSNTHEISIWDLTSGSRRTVCCHSHNIPSVAFNFRGQLASTSIDSTVCISAADRELALDCRPCTEWGWAVTWVKRSAVCEVQRLPASNVARLRGRYQSSLPTVYFNQNAAVQGTFSVTDTRGFFDAVRRRVQGLPDDDSDSEEEQVAQKSSTPGSEEFGEQLVLQTSKTSIHLIDPSLHSVNPGGKLHVLAVYIPALEIMPGNFSRLSLLYVLEEFSLCVVGNQFGPEIVFLKLCKTRNKKSVLGWDYSFVMEISIRLNRRIMGMTVNSFGDYALMYALTENMSFYVFKVMNTGVEKLRVINV